jgi:hypothetical protein
MKAELTKLMDTLKGAVNELDRVMQEQTKAPEPPKDRVGEIIRATGDNICIDNRITRLIGTQFKVVRWGNQTLKHEMYLNDSGFIDPSGYPDGYSIPKGFAGTETGFAWILKPLLDHRTVHVFDANGKRYKYGFDGTPDLDRIYRETIGAGALVAYVDKGVHVFVAVLDKLDFNYFGHKLTHGGKVATFFKEHFFESIKPKLAAAVKSYVEKAKEPSCRRENCQFYAGYAWKPECQMCKDMSNFKSKSPIDPWTVTIGGIKLRAYEPPSPGSRDVWLFYTTGNGSNGNIQVDRNVPRLFDIPIMPYSEHKGDMRKPE